MTFHARKEMNNDELTIYDVEDAVLTGEIVERQRDTARAEWKYRINGESIEGGEVEIVVKLSPTNKLVIITVYLV